MMRSRRQIGLDIGHAWIKAAMRDRSGRLTRIAAFPRSTPGAALEFDEAAFIAETLLRQGFESVPVVLGVSTEHVRLEELEAPVMLEGSALDRIILGELSRLTHWEPESFTGQWWPVPTSLRAAATGSYLTVAAPTAAIEALVAPLLEVGFDIMAVDLLTAATMRVCSRGVGPDHLVVSVDIGFVSTELSALLDGSLVLVRRLPHASLAGICRQLPDLPSGRAALLERLCTGQVHPSAASHALLASFNSAIHELADLLQEEIERTLAYLARRFPSATRCDVFLCGGGARIDALVSTLGQSPDVLARRPELPACQSHVGRRWSNEPMCIAACGLALWAEEAG
ncbi:MAG: hypothetical protein Kow0022_04370 [Phycisphaerales bacterium]